MDHFLSALKDRYGHLVEFCVGGALGRAIGLKWKAQAFMPAPMRVPNSHCTIPGAITGLTQPHSMTDTASVLSDMQSLGEGLVANVLLVDSSHLL